MQEQERPRNRQPQAKPEGAALSKSRGHDTGVQRVNGNVRSLQAARQLAQQNHCVQCHGPALGGQEHIPRIAAQDYDYVLAQLQGFKAATRPDIDGLMTSAAQPLADADLALLAKSPPECQ